MTCCNQKLIKNVRGIFKYKVFSKKNKTLLTHAVCGVIHTYIPQYI